MKNEFKVIADLIEKDKKVLDVGCADGTLMKFLKDNKNIKIRGLEISKDKVQKCIAKGLTVIEGNAEKDLMQNEKQSFDYVVLLQPTSPFREAKHIDAAFLELQERSADAVISVCETEHNPLWSNTLNSSKSLEGFLKPELINSRSQDLETHYRLNGALYICDVKRLVEEDTFFIQSNCYAYEMSQIDSVDIDTELDFLLAETILKRKEK